jgi:hypothetical protein
LRPPSMSRLHAVIDDFDAEDMLRPSRLVSTGATACNGCRPSTYGVADGSLPVAGSSSDPNGTSGRSSRRRLSAGHSMPAGSVGQGVSHRDRRLWEACTRRCPICATFHSTSLSWTRPMCASWLPVGEGFPSLPAGKVRRAGQAPSGGAKKQFASSWVGCRQM